MNAELTLDSLCEDRRSHANLEHSGNFATPDFFSQPIELGRGGGRILAHHKLKQGQVFFYVLKTENGHELEGSARVVWTSPLAGDKTVAGFALN